MSIERTATDRAQFTADMERIARSQRASYTPGPWRVETWNYGKSTGSEREVPTIQTDRDAIAQALDLWPPDERQAERDANARLIARAPTMHALLTAAQVYCPVHVQDQIRLCLADIEGDSNG
jgi:hypothetical protein